MPMVSDSPAERRAGPASGVDLAAVLPPTGEGQELVYRDDLTGLYNRRALSRLFAERWPALLAAHREVALLILDLDLFKEVNDTHGHLVGDEVLRAVADLLREGFRATDLRARYGGDEFVVVLPGVGAEEARGLAERIRQALEGRRFGSTAPQAPAGLAVSFSLGVAASPVDGATGEAVLQAADRRLYEEKRHRSAGTSTRWRVALFALVVALAAAGSAFYWVARRSEPSAPVPPAAATAVTLPAGAIDDSSERARIAELQAEVERLRQELAEARLRGESGAAAERRRSELESLLRRLVERRDLEGRGVESRPTAAGGGVEAVAPSLAVPVVPASPGEPSAGATHLPDEPSAAPAPGAPAFTPPELLSVVRPDYPVAARRMRRTATVELHVRIDAEGHVTAAEPLGPPAGLGFDQAAYAAAMQARYRPALRAGRPVASEAKLSIVFDLRGRD